MLSNMLLAPFALFLSIASGLPYEARKALEARDVTNLRILPLGDSITFGYMNGGGTNGYRLQLLNDLKGANYTVDYVGTQKSGTMADKDNEGRSGYTISQIQGAAGAAIRMSPNLVLLHAGTNDLNRGNNPPEPDAQAPQRLGSLLDDVLKANPKAVVIVAKIIQSKTASLNTKVKTFNSGLEAIVAARVSKGSNVSLVDMSILTSNELSDNLHPNGNGYSHMGNIWFAGIKAVSSKIIAPV